MARKKRKRSGRQNFGIVSHKEVVIFESHAIQIEQNTGNRNADGAGKDRSQRKNRRRARSKNEFGKKRIYSPRSS